MGEQPMRADFQNVRCLGIVGLLAGMVVSTSAAAGPAVPADEPDAAVIVAEGVAQAAIVVAEDASEAVLRAAEELRRCIEQMTTVALPLADDASVREGDAELPGLLICVGPSDLTAEVSDGLPGDPYAPGGQDAVAKHADGKIVLTGGPVLDGQTTEHAVAAFLRHLGAECYGVRHRPIMSLPATADRSERPRHPRSARLPEPRAIRGAGAALVKRRWGRRLKGPQLVEGHCQGPLRWAPASVRPHRR